MKLRGDDPNVDSLTPIWPGANFFEREVFDLFGVRFDEHPNLDAHHDAGELGRPSAAQGLSRRGLPLMAHMTPTPVLDPSQDKTMVLNMGPQHPSTHGVLRLLLEIDGETIVRIMPDIGYLHTGIEKTCEAKFYQQVVPMTDRIDYLCPMTNNLAYCLAVEKLLGLEIPPRAQWLRVLLNELTRINSHLVWLGTHAMDIGAMTVFLYCFREREDVLRLFEAVSGQRMMTSYFRIGGLALEPPLGLFDRVKDFLDALPRQHRRIREPADAESDLRESHQGCRVSFAGRRHCAVRDRADAARQRRRCRSAPRRAVHGIRELQVQRADFERWRRVRAVPGARGRSCASRRRSPCRRWKECRKDR